MKLAIVNDSPTACEALQRLLQSRPDCTLLWTAHSGAEAVEFCRTAQPEIILMDMVMPGMDGAEATRQILAKHSCAILVVTASITQNTAKIFEAMGAGALDVATTPNLNHPAEVSELFRKLDQIQRLRFSTDSFSPKPSASPRPALVVERAILIGASAGGPAALAAVLSELPPDLPLGIIIAQHMDSRFDDAFISWLSGQTKWPIRKAQAGDRLRNGEVLVAGAERHLIFIEGNQLAFTDKPAFAYIPSIDMLFSSAAQCWRGALVAVLLTGMGSDGAKGLKLLREAGHLTIAQDQATSALYGMPKAAAEMDAAREILPLNQISQRLVRFSNAPVATQS